MRYFVFFFFSAFALSAAGQRVTNYLTEVCNVIKKNALYADSINWMELQKKVTTLSQGLTRVEECKPIIDTIVMALRQAGDKHSGFIDKKTATQITTSNYSGKPIESKYLNDNIGYIKVPMFASIDLAASEKFASEIQERIRALDVNQEISGWIVDLRGNNGGNMHPMIKGLSCFIGKGVYGYVVSSTQTTALSTETGQTGFVKLPSFYSIKHRGKIAVLIDSATASSGEFTAIAFKKLPNVQFFGQPSGGYTTSNQTFRLPDGAFLYLATAFMADRKKKTYLPNIVPDVIVEKGNDNNSDPVINVAKDWLVAK